MKCVLLVENHSAFREALAKILEWHDNLVDKALQASSISEARGRAGRFKDCLDVAVIELGLPDGDGLDLIKELRESEPEVPVLVLTNSSDPASHDRAIKAGAGKVLTKSSSLEDIIEALWQISGRETYELDAFA